MKPIEQAPYYSSLKVDALNYGIEILNFKAHKQQTPTAAGYSETSG